jgi:hypothetical protein
MSQRFAAKGGIDQLDVDFNFIGWRQRQLARRMASASAAAAAWPSRSSLSGYLERLIRNVDLRGHTAVISSQLRSAHIRVTIIRRSCRQL